MICTVSPIKAPEFVLSGSFKTYLHQYCHEQDFSVLILLADNVVELTESDIKKYTKLKEGTKIEVDDLNVLPEKFRDKAVFRQWVDKIFPTEIFPKQQKAIADIAKRIVEV